MPSGDVTIPLAFGAGFLSFFTPCILPMIPAYIMYLTGSTVEEEVVGKRFYALTRTIGFVIGFTIIFVLMGTSASAIGRLFIGKKMVFTKISGIIIIIFGLDMMGIVKLNLLRIEKRVSGPKEIKNWFNSITMGMAFAAGWTPCFGPILGSILIYAGAASTVSRGVILLLIYSMGMALPFVLTALFINVFTALLNKTGRLVLYLPKIGGLFMVIFGLLVYLNKVASLNNLFQ